MLFYRIQKLYRLIKYFIENFFLLFPLAYFLWMASIISLEILRQFLWKFGIIWEYTSWIISLFLWRLLLQFLQKFSQEFHWNFSKKYSKIFSRNSSRFLGFFQKFIQECLHQFFQFLLEFVQGFSKKFAEFLLPHIIFSAIPSENIWEIFLNVDQDILPINVHKFFLRLFQNIL